MKPILAAAALFALGCLAVTGQGRIGPQELPNALPADAKVEQFTLTTDGQRAYYTTPSGGIWLYDRTRKTSSRIMTGSAWDLTVSAVTRCAGVRDDNGTLFYCWRNNGAFRGSYRNPGQRRRNASLL